MIVETDGARLSATYSSGGSTAIIGLHGASDGTRDHLLFRHLHRIAPPIGVGVVTFDRRGEGQSTGFPSVGHFQVQADDAVAVARSVSGARVGFWGYSQGAWVAPLAAEKLPAAAFLVLVSAAAVTPARQMEFGAAEHLRRAGYPDDVVDRAVGLRQRFAVWAAGADDETLAADLAASANDAWWPLSFLRAELPDEAGRRDWHAEMSFDPVPVYARVAVPTLLLYGSDDVWVPVEESAANWREIGGPNVDLVVIDGASHDMLMPSGEISAEYEQKLEAWLRTHS